MEVDARPSDAIAIGLRFDSPIFTYENILAEAGIVLTDEAEEEAQEKKSEPKSRAKKEVATSRKSEDFKNYSVERLNELLKEAIDKEDYERAAKIRDELSKRN
jgi:bifunctional DNase/RNase